MTIRNAALTAVLAAVIGSGIANAQNATIRPSPEAPLRATPRSNEEQQAFFEVQNAATPRDQLREADDFMASYFDSEYRHLVLFYDWRARGELGQDPKNIIDVALRAIEAQDHFLTSKLSFIDDPSKLEELPEVEFTLANREAIFYQSIVEGYLAEKEFDKVLEYGDLAIESVADAQDKLEGIAGTPEYDQAAEQLRGVQLFVLNAMFDRYAEEDDFENVVRIGSQILDVAPDDTFVARTIVQGYQDRNDVEQSLAWGRKLLEGTPNDLNALMMVSRIMAEQDPGDDAAVHWREAKDYAARASEQLDVYLAGPDSAQLNDDQKAGFVADVNTTLGFASLQTKEFQDATAALQKAAAATPDDANLYQMMALAAQGSRDLEGMMSALARAVYLEHPDPNLRNSLTLIYENVNGSRDGLDDYIKSEGEKIDD